MNKGRRIPPVASVLTEEEITFATEIVDSSKVAGYLESLLVRQTGRPRRLPLRALLVALLLLALDERFLHLKAATKLLFCDLPAHWRHSLGVHGDAGTRKSFLARYRQVRYLFHLALSVMDPSVEVKNRVMDKDAAVKQRKQLTPAEVHQHRQRLEAVVAMLLQASIEICSEEELSGYDGSVGLSGASMEAA
jgi:hypothetical protein